MYKKTTNNQDLPKHLPVAEAIKQDVESGKHDELLAEIHDFKWAELWARPFSFI